MEAEFKPRGSTDNQSRKEATNTEKSTKNLDILDSDRSKNNLDESIQLNAESNTDRDIMKRYKNIEIVDNGTIFKYNYYVIFTASILICECKA